VQATKTPKLSSYGLKHAAERWGECHGMEPYVSNGEFIVAAVYLGFKIKLYRGSLNVKVAVSVEDVQRLDPECIWSSKYSPKAKKSYWKERLATD
jgi:hypothetical protein